MLNALSIDVEEYFQVEAFRELIPSSKWDDLPPRIEANVEYILERLAQHQVKATFFCLGWIAQNYPSLIKKIAEEGHEIASHGWSHTPIHHLTPEDFRLEIRKSKALLEDLTGKEVIGFRAPTYSITFKTLWALTILAEEGFRYDSSIFPIYHDLYGFPESPRFPYLLEDLSLKEFPISTFRFKGINLPLSGGGYFRLFPYLLTRFLLKRFQKKEKKPFVFYIHPWEFDPEQPRFRSPLKSRFRHYLNLSKTKIRFENLLNDFSFAPVKEVLENLKSLPVITLEELKSCLSKK